MTPSRRRSKVGLLTSITASASTILCADAFAPASFQHILARQQQHQIIENTGLYAKKKAKAKSTGGGFGGGFGTSTAPKKKKSGKPNLISALNDEANPNKKKKEKEASRTYVKSDQEQLINELAAKSSSSVIGRAVAKSPDHNTPAMDPFWELLPSLISTKFPSASDDALKRVAGMVEFSVGMRGLLEDDVVADAWRPHEELHAYMPGLGAAAPFLDPNELELCNLLSENYDVIAEEYEVLLENRFDRKGKDRFQSVTSMNYDSGWKTMVLFYNGHRIKDFPYDLCPVTTRIMESVPLAGRIAGFNRQQPESGIPLHSDGNNMWLTCQMGIKVPPAIVNEGSGKEVPSAHIRVGPETRHWEEGKCLLYDTTYEHETFNAHPTEERVVLHVDFFNTLKMTKLEIDVLQYMYLMREQFMKAEGVAKVGAQVL